MLRRRNRGPPNRRPLPHQHRRKGEIAETVRSAPGRDPRMARFIRIFGAMARESQPFGEPRRPGTSGGLTQPAPAVSFGSTFGDIQHSGAPMTAAFTFPGQASQAVGMGKALAEAFPAAQAVFDEVDAALREKLTGILWYGQM